MTDREEFEKWFNEEFGDDYAHTEAMLLAWQARGELDAAKIKELERALHEINRLRSATLNFGVARAMACKALGIKHTDSTEPPIAEKVDMIKQMVSRFLSWKLPADFHPDAGISFSKYSGDDVSGMENKPVGTNLFHAGQAEVMINHIIGDSFADLQSQLEASQVQVQVLREALQVADTRFGFVRAIEEAKLREKNELFGNSR